MNFKFLHILCAVLVVHNTIPSTSGIAWPGVDKILQFGLNLLTQDKNFMKDKVPIPEMIRNVSTAINGLERSLKLLQATIIHEINRLINYHQKMHDLTVNGVYIDNLYNSFQRYSREGSFEDSTLLNFAQSCVSHDNSQLPSILNQVYRLVEPAGVGTTRLFDLLIEDKRTKDDQAKICNVTTSPQQDVYLLHNIIGMYMVKGFAMKLYSYHVLKRFGIGQYRSEMEATKRDYVDIMKNIALNALNTMRIASRALRPCDAKIHKEGETYTQLKWLFGAFGTNEIKLHPDASCWKTCPDFKVADFHPNAFMSRGERCNGKVHDCFTELIQWYCPADQPYRRYNGFRGVTVIIGKDIPSRGNTENCRRLPMVADTHRVPNGMFTRCDECICFCDDYDYDKTVRTFSLRPVKSNVGQNRVVTGVKFVEKDRVFYLQIQDGKLGPNGTVDESTVRWQPIDAFDYKSAPSEDYYTVTYDRNMLNLDTLSISPKRVMTGIRFIAEDSRLKLSVRSSAMDYESGSIGTTGETWISDSQPHNNEVRMHEPHIPILAQDENIVNTQENSFIKFRQTDWKKDASQIAVPFIDLQPVIADPPVPLAGAGIFHKGLSGYGGFLGLRLITYDYTEFIDTNVNVNEMDLTI